MSKVAEISLEEAQRYAYEVFCMGSDIQFFIKQYPVPMSHQLEIFALGFKARNIGMRSTAADVVDLYTSAFNKSMYTARFGSIALEFIQIQIKDADYEEQKALQGIKNSIQLLRDAEFEISLTEEQSKQLYYYVRPV